MNFEINLIFQTKKSRQKFNYLENEKSFYKIKSIFYPFKRPSLKQISRVFLEAESPTFRVEFHVSHTEGFQGLLLTSEVVLESSLGFGGDSYHTSAIYSNLQQKIVLPFGFPELFYQTFLSFTAIMESFERPLKRCKGKLS